MGFGLHCALSRRASVRARWGAPAAHIRSRNSADHGDRNVQLTLICSTTRVCCALPVSFYVMRYCLMVLMQ